MLLVAWAATACDDAGSEETESAKPAPSSPTAASPVSFELVLESGGGARLVFATERELRERELDAHGVAGPERVLLPVKRPVLELSASDSGERLAVAWVERAQKGGKVRALLGGEQGGAAPTGDEVGAKRNRAATRGAQCDGRTG